MENCSAFCMVKDHKKRWRNRVYHDIIDVFGEGENWSYMSNNQKGSK